MRVLIGVIATFTDPGDDLATLEVLTIAPLMN
jgi:hypothetical protein